MGGVGRVSGGGIGRGEGRGDDEEKSVASISKGREMFLVFLILAHSKKERQIDLVTRSRNQEGRY